MPRLLPLVLVILVVPALTEITPAHYKRGTRLAAAVALNRNGKAIYTQHEQPNSVGVYPCQTPTNLGHGVKACR